MHSIAIILWNTVRLRKHLDAGPRPYNMLFVSIYENMMVPCAGHGFQHLPHQKLYSAYCSEVTR